MTHFGCLVLCVALSAEPARNEIPIRLPEGFNVALYADETLVHDVFSMTVNPQGQVVISGRGYIQSLLDRDRDGIAEEVQEFVNGPRTGAQGLCFEGNDLLAAGDEGVIRYRDANGDGVADGPPETLLSIKAGGEHEVHAIQKGPDGYWYVIAGNFAGVTKQTVTSGVSPVTNPRAGVLLRLSPDFRQVEVVAHGFRNAYDFAFNSAGDIFAYDSDGERDISLPWYRPTRVFQVVPAGDAGWVTQSWKRPNDYFDMMPVVANCGRGSPTGVVCYQHIAFPESYRDTIFVLDWTYGRVLVVRLDEQGKPIGDEPELFMLGTGDYGFAPTDIEVGPDGSLYVSVGGRGLRGSIYRVTHGRSESTTVRKKTDALTDCLNAHQPLSSWSRAEWLPQALQLGRTPFVDAALSNERTASERVRAIEILTELFSGVDRPLLTALADDSNSAVRARAIWSAGRNTSASIPISPLLDYLGDEHPHVRRAALDALMTISDLTETDGLAEALARRLDDDDLLVRQSASQVVGKLSPELVNQVAEQIAAQGERGQLWFHRGKILHEEFDPQSAIDASRFAISLLKRQELNSLHADAIRLLQLAWGDTGTREERSPVFDGYASARDLEEFEFDLDSLKSDVAGLYPLNNSNDYELARLISIWEIADETLLDKILSRITSDSDPVDDIHHLIVFSRVPIERTDEQRERVAAALLSLDVKMTKLNRQTESNWEDRITEMYAQLSLYDPGLSIAILKHPLFGQPPHVLYLAELPEEYLQQAIDAFTAKIAAAGEKYPWSTDVIFLLNSSEKPADRELIRKKYDDPSLTAAVTIALADAPEATDREKFVEGLASWQYEVLEASTNALLTLGAKRDPAELVALLGAVRRLGASKEEYPLREKLAKLLQDGTGIDVGFIQGEKGYTPQQEALDKWTTELTKRYPQEIAGQLGTSPLELSDMQNRLSSIDWDKGDIERGKILFQKRSCGHCHGGSQALGPNLSGVAKRFSREEIFTAILFPSRDVSPRYQASAVVTKEGKIYHGMIIYESVDGFILRNATLQTHRFNSVDVESRTVSSISMMPNGLLKDQSDGDWADLYAYLKTLE